MKLFSKISRSRNPAKSRLFKTGTNTLNFEKVPFGNIIIVSLAVNAAIVACVFLLRKFLPPQAPLYYGLPKSNEQIVSTPFLIIPAIASTAVLIINTVLAVILKEDFLKRMLILTSALSVFLSTITTIKIIFLVGSF